MTMSSAYFGQGVQGRASYFEAKDTIFYFFGYDTVQAKNRILHLPNASVYKLFSTKGKKSLDRWQIFM